MSTNPFREEGGGGGQTEEEDTTTTRDDPLRGPGGGTTDGTAPSEDEPDPTTETDDGQQDGTETTRGGGSTADDEMAGVGSTDALRGPEGATITREGEYDAGQPYLTASAEEESEFGTGGGPGDPLRGPGEPASPPAEGEANTDDTESVSFVGVTGTGSIIDTLAQNEGFDQDDFTIEETDQGFAIETDDQTVVTSQELRAELSQDLDVREGDLYLREGDGSFEFEVFAPRAFDDEIEDFAQEAGLQEDQVDIVRTEDGNFAFQPSGDVQQEFRQQERELARERQERAIEDAREGLREDILAENPDAENIQIEETDEGLSATYEVQREEDSPGIDDVIGGVQDPLGAAESIGGSIADTIDPRDNKAAAVAGAAVATPEPASTAAGALALGAIGGAAIAQDALDDSGEGETVTASASAFVDEIETPASEEEFEVVEVPVEEVSIEDEAEISVPEEAISQQSEGEFETPEEPEPPSEVETPERPESAETITEVPVIDQAELVSEYGDDADQGAETDPVIEEQVVISNEELVHPEEMRRRLERGESEGEFEEIEGEEVTTITAEDLADPEALQEEEEEQLAEQIEAHEQYLQEQQEATAGEEEGETEDIDDELLPLQEDGEPEFEGRQEELFTFVGGSELEFEEELEMEAVMEEQLQLLESAQSAGVGTQQEQPIPPALDQPADTETGVEEAQTEMTDIDALMDELTAQEQAFDTSQGLDYGTPTEQMATTAEPFITEFELGEPSSTRQPRLRLPSDGDEDERSDELGVDGAGEARFEWDIATPGELDVETELDVLGDLDDL